MQRNQHYMKLEKTRKSTLEVQFGDPLLRERRIAEIKTSEVGVGAQCSTFLSRTGLATLSSWFDDIKFSSECVSKKTDLSNGRSWEIKIQVLEMKEEMKDEAVSLGIEAIEKYTMLKLKDIALHIRRHFEKKYGGSWHCIVGDIFGVEIAHEFGRCVSFNVNALGFYLFQFNDP